MDPLALKFPKCIFLRMGNVVELVSLRRKLVRPVSTPISQKESQAKTVWKMGITDLSTVRAVGRQLEEFLKFKVPKKVHINLLRVTLEDLT